MDPLTRWLDALDDRHRRDLSFQEVRRGVQALSSLYVERRGRLAAGMALDGAGKRAAFASFFAPLHFLLIREIVRELGAAEAAVDNLLDLGCGTGVAGAAWASEMPSGVKVTGVDRNRWATVEARWTYGVFGIPATTRVADVATLKCPERYGIIAAFILNELSEEGRERWQRMMLHAAANGAPVLIIEPIAMRLSPWWESWARKFTEAGGSAKEWRFPYVLSDRLALMDKAAGLKHRELTGRSLWLPGAAT